MDPIVIIIIGIAFLLIFIPLVFWFASVGAKGASKNYKQFKENEATINKKLENDGFVATTDIVLSKTIIALYKGMKTVSREQQAIQKFLLDSKNERFAICTYTNATIKYFNFSDVKSFDVVESGRSSKSTTLASGVSAPIGNNGFRTGLGSASTTTQEYVKSLQFVIYTNDIDNPTYTIDLLAGGTTLGHMMGANKNTQSVDYEYALEVLQSLKSIFTNITEFKA